VFITLHEVLQRRGDLIVIHNFQSFTPRFKFNAKWYKQRVVVYDEIQRWEKAQQRNVETRRHRIRG
jgi:hypothetical protein